MSRRVIFDFAAFGMAYIVVLIGFSLIVGLILGILMRETPPATFNPPPQITRTATESPALPSATQTSGPVLAMTFTPSVPPTPQPAATSTPLSPTPAPTSDPCTLIHIVAAGDTVLGIAQRYGVSVDEIVRANNLQTTASLKIGQQIIVPTCATQAPSP